MAQVTRMFAQIGGYAAVHVVYDDAKLTPDGGAENCDLIRVDVTVLQPVVVSVVRGNGTVWQSRTLTESTSFNAGGPVRTVGALARYTLGTV